MLFQSGRARLLTVVLALLVAPASLAAPSSFAMAQDSDTSHDAASAESSDDHADGDHADGDHDSAHAEGEGDHAEGGHGGGHGDPAGTPPLLQVDIGSAICNLAIFLGVFGILSYFVWPTILGGLQAREKKIHDDLESAESANKKAEGLLAEYQSKLDDAQTQVQAMLAEARKDAEASGQRIVDAAKEEAERQRERAVNEIETAKKVAISELAGQTSDMAINVAKQVVGRELKADDHADLIRQALERLPSNN